MLDTDEDGERAVMQVLSPLNSNIERCGIRLNWWVAVKYHASGLVGTCLLVLHGNGMRIAVVQLILKLMVAYNYRWGPVPCKPRMDIISLQAAANFFTEHLSSRIYCR